VQLRDPVVKLTRPRVWLLGMPLLAFGCGLAVDGTLLTA